MVVQRLGANDKDEAEDVHELETTPEGRKQPSMISRLGRPLRRYCSHQMRFQRTARLPQERHRRRPTGPIAFSVQTTNAARSLRHERDHHRTSDRVIAFDATDHAPPGERVIAFGGSDDAAAHVGVIASR
jgi:hypothetical protein